MSKEEEKKQLIDLKSIYMSFLRSASPKETEDFLVLFIEGSDNEKNIKEKTDEQRIHDFEKESGINFHPVVVKKATVRLKKKLNQRLENLRE